MKIIDLDERNVPLYLVCLEDWSDEVKEAGTRREAWYRTMKEKGLRVKLALDDNGVVGGMIQYLPIKYSLAAEGDGLYYVNCIWVHGHKQGRGNFQGRGMGSALLEAAEADARSLGASGMAAWGLALPVWMRASWFKKHGFRSADRQGMLRLMWKPFTPDAAPPHWIQRKEVPHPEPDHVTVTAFCSGWCTAGNISFERAKRAATDPELADNVVFREVSTLDEKEFERWGMADGIFIDGKEVRTGPPPSYKKLRKLIGRKARKLKAKSVG